MPRAKVVKVAKPKVAKESKVEEKPQIEAQTDERSIQKAESSNSAIDPNAQFDKLDAAVVMDQLTESFSTDQIALILSVLKTKPDEISIQESRSNRVVDSGEFWKRQYKSQCIVKTEMETQIGILEKRLSRYQMPAQRTPIDGSDEGEVPTGPDPGPSEPRVGQPLGHPREKRKISAVDTIPDESNWMGTDVLALEYSQDHVMIVSYLYQISDDRRSLRVNPTPAICRKLLKLSWKALSDCIVKYTNFKGATNHSKETKCLMFLANKIIESFKSCVEISIKHYRTIAGIELLMKSNITYSLCSFFDKGLTELHNLCAGSDEVMTIGFITNLLIGILRSINWRRMSYISKSSKES
ncbi:hypothetical protein OCU04_002575 [Sclerotinia nivalis]|uniref:Uncharacterized protein n=1 Tax=Sclerotinia nivalis TaxID=352851 RepID=A0A9X0ATX5_9HELO|nr:hypothetical protein OCU04_002575 [Sclerotinia nivalis]